MEENKKSGKTGLVVIIIILLLVICGMGAFLFINKEKLFSKEITKNETVEKTTKEIKNLELTDEVKTKLERFTEIAVTPNVGYGTMDYFINGVNSIDTKTKQKMTHIAIYKDGKVTKDLTLSDEEASTLEGIKPEKNEIVDIVKVSDYKATYKDLFKEEANIDISELELTGCPFPGAINKEQDKLYYYHRCGGTSATTYDIKVTSIDSDKDYYYVHQEIVENNLATNETKTTKLLWKFDEDLKFISSEKE